STAPVIDGQLEDVWKQASPITELYQREPNNGELITQPTEVYVMYDAEFLYVGFRCYDEGDITAKELARDISLAQDDRVQIIFDTFLNGRTGYWFQIGPRGSIGDALVSENGAAFNKQWDGLWEGKAHIHEDGWDAEIAIPFKTMSFDPGQTTWGMKIIRHIKRKLEAAYWPGGNLNTYTFQVSDGGRLEGLEGITQGIGLDIKPYGLVGFDDNRGEKFNPVANIGGDVFYRLTPGLTGALTFNTDFAQTEADSRQINLTRFKLNYPEKRNFFLDGANYFNFGIDGERANSYSKRLIPFFSRNMGLSADGQPIPIIVGGKMTGQVGNWNIGALNILDQRSYGNENFTVGRVSRNIGAQSAAGVIGTFGDAGHHRSNNVLGADLKLATSKFNGNKNLAFTAYGLHSDTENIPGDTTSQISGTDQAFGAQVAYPNDLINFLAGYMQIGDQFNAGIGFVPRVGVRESYSNLTIGPRLNKYGIMQVLFGAGMDYITDLNNKQLTGKLDVTPMQIRFLSGDMVSYSLASRYELLDGDFTIFKTHVIPRARYKFLSNSLLLTSAMRRNVWASAQLNWGDFYSGRRQDLILSAGWKINVPLYVGIQYENNHVFLPDGDFAAEIYRVNADILFSPDITLRNFIQYDNLSETIGIQSRFRWIIKPGNELVFAYTPLMSRPLPDSPYDLEQNSFRMKLMYTFRF
ncbi:MAG: carbohydrate binding family 9 domain-containing protein, partial [Cyclobacteriaceae bacterium]|nr:carbohydrate binding family 9 domain-containing protein [Cyclobacteriaceae bacterium]